ncbi:MAG: pyridoxal-phosphate dependent enzyme [Candidatus Woesearchaeota archaeon]
MVIIGVISELIGKTPMIELDGILAKLETTNPTGSVKDRMAWHMIKKAEERGELKHGILVGISSGANILAAKRLKARFENVVTILPDRGERYLNKG